jgi:hypothetical protein
MLLALAKTCSAITRCTHRRASTGAARGDAGEALVVLE